MSSDLRTTHLNLLLDRVRQGDQQALDELFRRASQRLENIARSMLRRYPLVCQHEQAADIVQEASLSLLGALQQLHFASTRDFYGLAGEHIRRRLLDLTRRYANPARSPAPLADGQGEYLGSQEPDNGDLERWRALHEAAETLPIDCREVFSLRFYHGWQAEQIAELLQVSTRTVTRLWARALLILGEQLGEGYLPGEITKSDE